MVRSLRGPVLAIAAAMAASGALAHSPATEFARPPGPPRVILAEPPAVALPAQGALVVFYSGDGGWAHTDRVLSSDLTALGFRVAGIDSLHYFWTHRTPDAAAADLAEVVRRYGQPGEGVVLMGYSFGAAALPLIASRLSSEDLARIRLMVLVAPTDRGELVMRPQSWLDIPDRTSRPLGPALQQLSSLKVLCVYGDRDRHAACPRLDPPLADLRLSGGHHLRGQERVIVDATLSALSKSSPPAKMN